MSSFFKYFANSLIPLMPIVILMYNYGWFSGFSLILVISIILSHLIIFGVASLMLSQWVVSPRELSGLKFIRYILKGIGVGLLCNLAIIFVIIGGQLFSQVDSNFLFLIGSHIFSTIMWTILLLYTNNFKIKISLD